MPGRQRTFELVPTTLVNSDGPRRPMTSKAVKKAYQQRNRGPRVTRAEQRRLEAEELAKQKKEYERERAAIKSKAAREKKAAKEQAEKDERRKQGLPEPSKFVRASQPTISRFVRDGNKRSWQQMESVAEDSDNTICAPEDAGPPAKRVPTGPKRALVDDESEDEFGDFLSFSQLPALFEKIGSSLDNPEEGEVDSQLLPDRKATTIGTVEERVEDEDEDEDELADIQLLSEAAEAQATKIDTPHQSSRPAKVPYSSLRNINQNRHAINQPFHTRSKPAEVTQAALKEQSINIPPTRTIISISAKSASPRPYLQEQCTSMPPPRGPIGNPSKSLSFAPPFPESKAPSINPKKPQDSPSATQTFLESHLDDFFPSPSQQVRELLDDIDELSSNTQIARELTPIKGNRATTKIAREISHTNEVEDDPFDLICTQDLILSPQDLLEIGTPSKSTVGNHDPTPYRPSISVERRRFFEEKEDDLLHAALHESTIVAAQKEPEKVIVAAQMPGPAHRCLERIPSTFTDYGDEDFEELELFALY